nr:hypothetical protein [Cupriavidus sp. DB3]
MPTIPDHEQELADAFYVKYGPCCAGCDWWHRIDSLVGECHRSAPVSGIERYAMLGVRWTSRPVEAGHVLTTRDHRCGDFLDTFDWSSLPAAYLRRIGKRSNDGR